MAAPAVPIQLWGHLSNELDLGNSRNHRAWRGGFLRRCVLAVDFPTLALILKGLIMLYALTAAASFAAGFAYKAGKLDGAISWVKNQAAALYATATKPKEPKP